MTLKGKLHSEILRYISVEAVKSALGQKPALICICFYLIALDMSVLCINISLLLKKGKLPTLLSGVF